MAVLLAAVLISGCVQDTGTDGTDTGPTGGEQLTQAEIEDQAYQALEQEMDQAIDQMTLEELENELLSQG